MVKNKTTENEEGVSDYIATIADEKRRNDFSELVQLFEKQTRLPPKMWGTAIVGFGSLHYKYESGHEGDAPYVGLSSRVQAISLYLSSRFEERETLLQKFGKHRSTKACIYIKKLEDIDMAVLGKMIKSSVAHTLKTQSPC